MAVNFEIDDGVLVLRMVGTYSTAELRATLLESLAHLGPAGAVGMVFDVSASESLAERTADDVRTMGYFIAIHSHHFGRRVALVGSEDFGYGMMRLGSVILEEQGITNKVFRSHEEALAWVRAETPTVDHHSRG